jgi:hypothetical protein
MQFNKSYTWLSELTACKKLPEGKLDTVCIDLWETRSPDSGVAVDSSLLGYYAVSYGKTVLDVSNDRNAVIFNGKACFTLKVKALRSFNTAQQTRCSICTGHAVAIFFRTRQTVQYIAYHGVHCNTELAAESFWEANSSPASPKIPSMLWNLKIHYRVHNSPPLSPILSQINLVYAISS